MSFGDIVWFIIITFVFVAYLMVLFAIIGDLFRDRDTSGWAKAIWIIALIVLPYLSAFVYVVARGRGMAERRAVEAAQARQDTDAYIRQVAAQPPAPRSPADEIAQAQQMLDQGVISQPEYDRLKAKALA